jgi:ferredoxin--NADP+ reductase
MDPTRLSPAADNMLRRLERERKATLLYRSVPESISEVGGYPMAYFGDRRTPDLQFDHVVFAPPRQTMDPAALGVTAAALESGRVWFQGFDDETEGHRVSPGWRIGLDIAKACFPELDLAEPPPPLAQRLRHTAALDELRAEHYNAVITEFEPTHSDLWVLRVKPDQGETKHLPGQYASLGLGFWEKRIDDAEDPSLDQRWDRLIRRSYSISSRIFDDPGYLVDGGAGSELEFYIVLVPPTEDNVPALTPRLALKRPGDRIYLGPKVAGRYTLAAVTDPEMTVVFLATGTGEAPHNAMLVELLRKGHVGPIISAVSVRQWADLGYLAKHRRLEQRYANYHYVPLPTREPGVPKRYIQDLITGEELTEPYGVVLDPATTHVFLCGNPAMIGLPEGDGNGEAVFPEPTGVVELLADRGFTLDRRRQPGNIHYEEYW